MGAATAVSRVCGMLRVLAIAAVLGTTYLGNTFQSSNSVSNVLFELIAAGALSAVLVPTFVGLLDRGEPGEVERLAGGLLGLSVLVLGAVSVVGVVGAPWIADLLTAGVKDPHVAAQQQELSTFLLRFFVPQVVLYALGAIAIAVLQAKRQFAVGAAAPIGNTVVMILALLVFRLLYGPGEPTLDLTFSEQLALALGGTLGVAAFVGIPAVAVRRGGMRWRLHLPRRDPAVSRLLRLSGWAVLLHVGVGLLLGAAMIVGNGVEGGVVAYQVAFVFFLAPYAVLAQPIHTAILPELTLQSGGHSSDAFAGSLRWALDRIVLLVVPVSALLVALAEPVMRVFAFGKAATTGSVDLLAAALASLSVGLVVYSAFLLFARAYYALGDSRTPALVALVASGLGIVTMVAVAVPSSGSARVAALGFGHSAAYAVGALVLGVGLTRRLGHRIVPRTSLYVVLVAVVVGAAAWLAIRSIDPTGRVGSALAAATVGAVALGLMTLCLRPVHRVARTPAAPTGPT
ncbi:MAG: lipid II flippase MurJ [Acidimicrobiia bacterium]